MRMQRTESACFMSPDLISTSFVSVGNKQAKTNTKGLETGSGLSYKVFQNWSHKGFFFIGVFRKG